MFRKTLKTAVGAFNKVCNLLLGIVMVAMFLVLLLQIISRFIAFIPLPWSQDLDRLSHWSSKSLIASLGLMEHVSSI